MAVFPNGCTGSVKICDHLLSRLKTENIENFFHIALDNVPKDVTFIETPKIK